MTSSVKCFITHLICNEYIMCLIKHSAPKSIQRFKQHCDAELDKTIFGTLTLNSYFATNVAMKVFSHTRGRQDIMCEKILANPTWLVKATFFAIRVITTPNQCKTETSFPANITMKTLVNLNDLKDYIIIQNAIVHMEPICCNSNVTILFTMLLRRAVLYKIQQNVRYN